MESYASLLAIAFVSLIAAVSPGPDFFIVLKNSVSHSRKAGFLTTFGVSIALLVHLSYTLLGLGVVIAESPLLFAMIKYAGVGYLFYIGLTSALSSLNLWVGLARKLPRLSDRKSPHIDQY